MKRIAPAAVALVAAVVTLGVLNAGSARAEQPITLWLPWEGGSLWTYTGGPHGDFGEALDLQPPDASGKPCESFHSSFYVVAAANGTVSSVRPNVIEIDHGQGFATAYYHLEQKLVKLGDEVHAGDRLGLPGCCPDGWGVEGCYSEAPHLHFYTLLNGVRQPAVGLNLGGWVVGEDHCLHRTHEVRCEFGTRIVSNSPLQGTTTPSTGADLAVIIDTSSIRDEGRQRVETALAVLQATRGDDRVAVIEFNEGAKVRQPLTPAVSGDVIDAELVEALDVPDAGGRTNVRLGMVTGCAELLANGEAPVKAAILITDGKHNKGSFSGAEECFSENGIPVFTFGVGADDQWLLRRVAEKTGGQYVSLAETDNLYCDFLRIRTVLSGDPPGQCSAYPLKPGEDLSLPFTVPEDQDEALFEIRWRERRAAEQQEKEGIPIRAELVGPDGRRVPLPHQNVRFEEHDGWARFTLGYPAPGMWKVVISPTAAMPLDGIFLTFSAATITQASPFVEVPGAPVEQTATPEPTVVEETETPIPSETPTPRPTRSLPSTSATPPHRTPAPTDVTDSPTPDETPVPTRDPGETPADTPTPETSGGG